MAKHLHAPELTDEVIEAAFCGANFGRTDYRDFLAHSVLKKACDWHCGYTITCIMVELKLITPKTHKVTKLGKLFLTDSYPDPFREVRAAPPASVKLPAVVTGHDCPDHILDKFSWMCGAGWMREKVIENIKAVGGSVADE